MLYFKIIGFPDFVLTSKPKDVRMGKGKGQPSRKVSLIKKNQFFMVFKLKNNFNNFFILLNLVKQIQYKLSFRTKLTYNN